MSETRVEAVTRRPAPALRPYVRQYAGFRGLGLSPGLDTAVPSKDAHIIISLDGRVEVVHLPSSGARQGTFSALVSGLQHRPAIVRRPVRIEVMHVFLTPFGVQSLLGLPGATLASQVIELADLWGRARADTLLDEVEAAKTWADRFDILDRRFQQSMRPVEVPAEVAWAWDCLRLSSGRVSVATLARQVGWSRRYLTNRFHVHVGWAPKTAARVLRFELACGMLQKRAGTLAHVAAKAGYHDQAHMVRDWKSLAGCAPSTWIAENLPLSQAYEIG